MKYISACYYSQFHFMCDIVYIQCTNALKITFLPRYLQYLDAGTNPEEDTGG